MAIPSSEPAHAGIATIAPPPNGIVTSGPMQHATIQTI